MDKEAIKNSHGVGPCDVVYTNHDSFDRDGDLHTPQFKPVFSPDLLYSYNYLGPLVFLSRRVLEAIQSSVGFSSESFDYDLVLKATAQAERVERIDKVLYHVQNAASILPDADRISSRREEEAFRRGGRCSPTTCAVMALMRWFLPMFPIVSIPFVIECPMRRQLYRWSCLLVTMRRCLMPVYPQSSRA